MRKFLFSVATIFAANFAIAQLNTYTFNFDDSNGLSDFSQIDGRPSPRELPENFFTLSSTNGITNGALVPPDFVRYTNTVLAQYKWNIKKKLNEPIEISVAFKYDKSLLNVDNSLQPVVAFYLVSDYSNNGYSNKRSFLTGFNNNERYLVGFVAIQSEGLFWKSTDTPLVNGNWYKAKVTLNPTSDNFGEIIYVTEELFDLGILGTNEPASLGSLNWNFYNDVENTNEFTLQFFSHKNGGVKFIDDLTFTVDRGTFLNIMDNKTAEIEFYPNPVTSYMTVKNVRLNESIEILDLSGRLVNKIQINSLTPRINLEQLSKGIYIIKIGELTSKFIKN